AVLYLKEGAMTLRTAECRRLAILLDSVRRAIRHRGALHLCHHGVGAHEASARGGWRTAEPGYRRAQLTCGSNLGDVDTLDHRLWHAGIGRLCGILGQHKPTPLLDGDGAGRTVENLTAPLRLPVGPRRGARCGTKRRERGGQR